MNKNQKGFANIVIAVLAVLILGGAGYWYATHYQKSGQPITNPIQVAPLSTPSPTPTTNETAGWRTYNNTKYGFSISFPANVTADDGVEDFVQSFPNGSKITNYETFCYGETDNTIGNCFDIHLLDNDLLYDLIKAKEKYGINSPEIKLQEVTVNGNYGISGEICESKCVKTYTFQLTNNHRISISFGDNLYDQQSKNISPLALQILNTFKITNPSN